MTATNLTSETATRTTEISRRGALSLAGLLAAGSALAFGTQSAAAGDEHAGDEGNAAAAGAAVGAPRHTALIKSAMDCIEAGEICTNHCIASLSTGDTMLKDCLRTIQAMMPACTGLARLAALDAPRLKEFAKVCMDICDDCEKECRKHEKHHAICKACADSCVACIKECKAAIG